MKSIFNHRAISHGIGWWGMVAVMAALGPAESHGQEKRVALVVGVDQYDRLPPEGQLNVAVSDARTIAAALQAVQPAFDVVLLADSNKNEVEQAFDRFLDSAVQAECALIYFAGHGIEYNGSNYLLMKDTDVPGVSPDVERMKRRLNHSCVSLQAWVDSLEQTEAKVKVVILDCCRDNPLRAESPTGTRSVVGGGRGLAQLNPPSGTLISYSADAGQRANDGLFTTVLSDKLQTPGMTLLQVFAATREEVSRVSTQWAQEDSAKGLPEGMRRVHHEPAEYTKLNLAGTNFAFTVAPPAGSSLPSSLIDRVGSSGTPSTMATAPGGSTAGATKTPMSNEEVLRRAMAWKTIVDAVKAGNEAKRKAAATPSAIQASTSSSGMSADLPPSVTTQEMTLEGNTAGEICTIGGIEMVWCPPGTFMMGAPQHEEKWQEDDLPYQVTLTRGFWIARYELTQAQWRERMGTGPAEQHALGDAYGQLLASEPDHPMYFLSWFDCQKWLTAINEQIVLPEGYRWHLPTEAQWEYACRAGTHSPYAFGRALNGEAANCDGNFPYGGTTPGPKLGVTARVGSYPANAWNIHDMHGNVSEWCQDWYHAYPGQATTDPTGSVLGTARVLRGGSWSSSALGCRSAYRAYGNPQERHANIGFRPIVFASGK